MNRHPGGNEHTIFMAELAGLRPLCHVVDLGAGDGEAVRLLRGRGYDAEGIDLSPGADVIEGNLLKTPYPDGSFDAALAQCSFFLSGNVDAAFGEAYRLLKQGGTLLYSDVCFESVSAAAARAGFSILFSKDMTPLWREYYINSLWNGTADCLSCTVPKGKCSYTMLICRKE